MSIREFCAAHGFSRGQYYRLKAQGHAPRETRFGAGGKIVLITEESAREWRKRHTEAASSAA
jgi:predicted DNA-binding transcriptional regulator AlpA